MDYGKYRYEQEQKAKLARKHQTQIHVKEIKLRPKIGIHDYETKKGHVVRFLNQRAKVKVTIMFRGREQQHPERGRDLLMRLAEDVKEIGRIESAAAPGRAQHGDAAGADKERGSEKTMPKTKRHSGAKKRFKLTGTGKLLRRHAMKSPHSRAQVGEAQAPVSQGRRRRQGATSRTVKRLLGRG